MIIVGAGRVGGALVQRAHEAKVEHALVDRTRGWDVIDATDAPIFIAVRNDDLGAMLERIDKRHHGRLVFTQNGMLRPWLKDQGLETTTRGLLFFAVPTRGAPLEPGGQSPFTGPHAEATAAWLQRLQIPAAAVEPDAFAVTELEKLLWNCCFGLLCEHTGKPVGLVVEEHAELLSQLAEELMHVGMPAFGLNLDEQARDALKARLSEYSRSIPDYRGAVKEWPWRNGWFTSVAREPGLHEDLLEKTGHLPR